MKVTHVSLCPTERAQAAGRPALTPELLAATGARYSRSNDGLEAILGRIDPANLDRSVDSIFRMIDYGHQSIADMAPVAMFIDGVSIWLAYYFWSLCPTAGGQESSTRYIRLSPEGLIAPEALGIEPESVPGWRSRMKEAFGAYESALRLWEEVAERNPEATRFPSGLLADTSDKAARQRARMLRNFAFDRARNFIPSAAATNLMLIMSARGWVALCQHLLSHLLPEPRAVGEAIVAELELSAPRLLKHAVFQKSMREGIDSEFQAVQRLALAQAPSLEGGGEPAMAPGEFLEVFAPDHMTGKTLGDSLRFHEHRYAWMGQQLRRVTVRFGWTAVGFAEIRDLNRHRTGNKYCPFVPVGFYSAEDQCAAVSDGEAVAARVRTLAATGAQCSKEARRRLREGDPSYVYYTLLGSQFGFEHTTSADKFIYEAELRTGTGAHFRYADHLRAALRLWYEQFPETRSFIHEGSAEPE